MLTSHSCLLGFLGHFSMATLKVLSCGKADDASLSNWPVFQSLQCPLSTFPTANSTVGFFCRLCRTYFSHSIVGLSLFCATCIFHLSSGNGKLSHCLRAHSGACPLRLYAWLIVALSCAQFGVWAQVLLRYRSHYVRPFRYSAVSLLKLLFRFSFYLYSWY